MLSLDPECMARRGLEGFGKWRSCVKNEFVFPSFFGAGARKIARLTQIRQPIIERALTEFWKQFAAVKRWQKKTLRDYEKHGYVESPLGFRRYAPLKYNMIINTPIQSTASDICVEAATRCYERARAGHGSFWTPIMNIHDDLTFEVPRAKVDAFIPELARCMIDFRTDPRFAFLAGVPLTCEVEVGEHWGAMKSVATYRSDQL